MTEARSRTRAGWVALLCLSTLAAYTDQLARGDAAWADRARGSNGERPA